MGCGGSKAAKVTPDNTNAPAPPKNDENTVEAVAKAAQDTSADHELVGLKREATSVAFEVRDDDKVEESSTPKAKPKRIQEMEKRAAERRASKKEDVDGKLADAEKRRQEQLQEKVKQQEEAAARRATVVEKAKSLPKQDDAADADDKNYGNGENDQASTDTPKQDSAETEEELTTGGECEAPNSAEGEEKW